MKSKAILWIIIAVVAVVFVGLAFFVFKPPQQKDSLEVIKEGQAANTASKEEVSDVLAKDDPEAHGLYEKMIETMRKAETLSYKSTHRDVSDGEEYGRSRTCPNIRSWSAHLFRAAIATPGWCPRHCPHRAALSSVRSSICCN